MALCHPSGRLVINGAPMSDEDLSRLTGEPIKLVRLWLKELGAAGIYSVDQGGLYMSKMTKDHQFSELAKISGSKGQKIKQGKAKVHINKYDASIATVVAEKKTVEKLPVLQKAKPLPWWKSPAGWVRYGASQATSIKDGESLDDFKFRLSCKIPPGPHLSELTDYHQKEVARLVEKYEAKPGEKPMTM